MSENTTRERIANIGAGIVPTYHATESVDEAKAVVEQCTITTDELLVTGYPNSLRPELHKALKARGIGYWVAQGITFWNRDDGCECLAYGYQVNGVPRLAVKVVGFTDPEQAIAATLGRETCTAVSMRERDKRPYLHDELVCSKCGCQLAHEFGHVWQHFCPNCGAKVVEPTTNDVGGVVDEWTDELKPCPFCGSNAETVHTLNVVPHEPWWVRCPSCGVTTPKYSSETDAIAAWNRRTQ